jgi:transposase
MKNFFIGIDISKEKLNLCLLHGGNVLSDSEIKNTIADVKTAVKSVLKRYAISAEQLLLCAEYTGQYIYPLCCACEELSVDLWMENPAQIKASAGFVRGKDDAVDARRIAEYAARFEDKAKLYKLPQKNIASLRRLISERELYVADRAKYQGQRTDQARFMSRADFADKQRRQKRIIAELDNAIALIDKEIQDIIAADEELSRQQELLRSVEGVGPQVAAKMIAETNAFRDFASARQFACHAGVAPFEYCSGSSIRSRRRVSQRADKRIKALLHMAAMTVATNCHGELSEYYARKVAEGKNKMLVLNAIRAKLIARMFAVIRDNKPYEKNFQFSLVLS